MYNKTITWVGAGVMGEPMAKHLRDGGNKIKIFARSSSKLEYFQNQGFEVYDNLGQSIKGSDVIITILGDVQSVKDVYYGNGCLVDSAVEGQVFVDMTTTSPVLMEEIETKLTSQKCFFLDSPVTGGDVGAKNATLSIMVGGDEQKYAELKPILDLLGKSIVYHGKIGNGQRAKLANQIAIAGQMIGMCESMIFASKAGLDLEKFLESVCSGSGGCWSLSNLAPRILRSEYGSGFKIQHFVKDLKIVLKETKSMGIKLQGVELIESIYEDISKNYDESQKGTHYLYEVLNKIDCNNTKNELNL